LKEHGAHQISRYRQGCAVPRQTDDVQVGHGGLDLPKEKDVDSTSEQTLQRELLQKKGLVGMDTVLPVENGGLDLPNKEDMVGTSADVPPDGSPESTTSLLKS
jgi:hypothetical protein